jgi:hypothetical protein
MTRDSRISPERFADPDQPPPVATPKTSWRVDLQWAEIRNEHRYTLCRTEWFTQQFEAEKYVQDMRAEPTVWLPAGGFDGTVSDPVQAQ